MAQVGRLGQAKGRRPSGAVLHSSHREPGELDLAMTIVVMTHYKHCPDIIMILWC